MVSYRRPKYLFRKPVIAAVQLQRTLNNRGKFLYISVIKLYVWPYIFTEQGLIWLESGLATCATFK